MLEKPQFIFIIGCPRSGTTMLQVLLSSHPLVASTVELTLFDRYIGPWLKTWRMEVANIRDKDWQQGLPMLWSEAEFDEFIREFLGRAYRKLLDRFPSATHVLDKHPGYSMHIEAIKRYLPRARFIHMIRDGRDVACSLRAAVDTMGFGIEHAGAAGRMWENMVRAAREAKRFEGDYLELRYEDVLARGVECYGRVLEFCGLPADEKWIRETVEANRFDKMKERQATADPNVKVSTHHYRRGKSGNWQSELSPADRYAFDRGGGALLRELGYAEEGWWAENSAQRAIEPLRSMARELARRLKILSARDVEVRTD
jgi:hypothetical protein